MKETNETPAVSVIIPTRNRAALLARALESVACQTLQDFECLVLDDGSGAEELAACAELCRKLDGRFQLHRPPVSGLLGTGPAAARNRGLALARGQFVAFCDDDDSWCVPNHLEVAVAALRRQEADFYFADMLREGEDGAALPNWFRGFEWLASGRCLEEKPAIHEVSRKTLLALLRRHYPHLNTCVVRRRLIEEVGGFWERLGLGEDINLVLRLAERAGRLLYRPDAVALHNNCRRHSITRDVGDLERWLQMGLVYQHARVVCHSGAVRRCARSLESWHLRELADLVRGQGRPLAALGLSWQACAVYPSLGTLRHLLGTLPAVAETRASGGCQPPVPDTTRGLTLPARRV